MKRLRCRTERTRREMLGANILGVNCSHKIYTSQLLNAERVSRTEHARVGRTSDVRRREITNRRDARPESVKSA